MRVPNLKTVGRPGHARAGDWTTKVGRRVRPPFKDPYATLLRLLGLDHNKLNYFYGGCKQLSQTGRQNIKEIVA